MNYYERHLGDYARDTAHLTMLEHGAYGLLLDRYYATEQGIPADQAHRVARARTRDERAAVDAVLAEFFVLVDGVWTHGRVQREITKAQSKIEAARENGKRGGRPKRNPGTTETKPTGFSPGSNSETQEKTHQAPDTRHQIPEIQGAQHSTVERALAVLRKSGFPDAGHDPRLLALIAQGATPEELGAIAVDAKGKANPWAWFLAAVEGRRADASRIALAPKVEAPWHESRQGIVAKGVELGIGEWTEPDWHAGKMPQWPVYQARVFEAAGYQPPRAS